MYCILYLVPPVVHHHLVGVISHSKDVWGVVCLAAVHVALSELDGEDTSNQLVHKETTEF